MDQELLHCLCKCTVPSWRNILKTIFNNVVKQALNLQSCFLHQAKGTEGVVSSLIPSKRMEGTSYQTFFHAHILILFPSRGSFKSRKALFGSTFEKPIAFFLAQQSFYTCQANFDQIIYGLKRNEIQKNVASCRSSISSLCKKFFHIE